MKDKLHSQTINFSPFDNKRLSNLCGRFDEHLRQIESRLQVELKIRGNQMNITGQPATIKQVTKLLEELYASTSNTDLDPEQIHLSIQGVLADMETVEEHKVKISTPLKSINPRTSNQRDYINRIHQNPINFGIGPAGTGKTYLAVACAVAALEQKKIRRIILVRPVVEAGERLGFLPGDLAQKIDPYLRPLYDAFNDMYDFEKVTRLLESQVIEIAPLAYMRGRTLNDAFIILDESQNTTIEQMQMFLTRIGFNSTAVITGDLTQIDLPRDKMSGLKHAHKILLNIPNIAFSYFEKQDVVRHPIVKEIIEAYERDSERDKGRGK